jgi:hypothetical protein
LGWKKSLITDEEMNTSFLWNTTLHHEGNRIPTPLENLVRSCMNCQGHWKYGQHIPAESPISPWCVNTLSNTSATTKTKHDTITPNWAIAVKKLCMRISTQVVEKINFFSGTLLETSTTATLLCEHFNLRPDCGRCSASVTSSHSEGQGSRHALNTFRPLRRKSAM